MTTIMHEFMLGVRQLSGRNHNKDKRCLKLDLQEGDEDAETNN